MTDGRPAFHAIGGEAGDARVRAARDRIAALLGRDDELHLGMAVFDLWAALDQLVDPLSPPPPPRPVWVDDTAAALRQTAAELSAALATAEEAGDALRLGRAARHVADALCRIEQQR